jgi:hypothetical protein
VQGRWANRWNNPDRSNFKVIPNFGESDSAGGIAGNHNNIGITGLFQGLQYLIHPINQDVFGFVTIGKEGVVGGISDRTTGDILFYFRDDTERPDSGIEDEDVGGVGHGENLLKRISGIAKGLV